MTGKTSRFKKDAGWVYVPRGTKRRCRWCDGEVKPPRRTFCSAQCVHEHKLRTSGSYVREWVEKRDKGVCRLCDLDTARLEKIFNFLTAWRTPDWKERANKRLSDAFFQKCEDEGVVDGPEFDRRYELYRQYRRESEDVFKMRHRKWLAIAIRKFPWCFKQNHRDPDWWYVTHLWEADHIIPVSEGGGECGLENYQTLCIPCHREETKKLRRRLAERKKSGLEG